MNRMVIAGVMGLLITGYALAQEHPEHPKPPKRDPARPAGDSTAAATIDAVVTGQNFCLGCQLKKDRGAAAQCDKYGHRHALRVTTAAGADGADLPALAGWVLHYLDTDLGQPFVKEHHDETLVLKGKVYTAERVLEVAEQKGAKKPEHPEHPRK
ncbi:MAG: hypothetical protein HY722_03310 [Planctomycetes bacterium]|nr:hypothetical protein [Planctomycetota bacterium]